MSADSCKVYRVCQFDVQENGIVRNRKGEIVGRLEALERLMRENAQLKHSLDHEMEVKGDFYGQLKAEREHGDRLAKALKEVSNTPDYPGYDENPSGQIDEICRIADYAIESHEQRRKERG